MPSEVGQRLTDMEYDEVSLVTRPANQMSKVVLFKSDTEDEMPEAKEELDVRKDGLLDTEVVDYITTLEKANEELFEALEAASAEGDVEEEDILKSADPRIVELVKSAEERALNAETIAKAERGRRREKEFIAKAGELSNIPGTAEETGNLLKAASDNLDADTFTALVDLLEKVHALIETGGALDEIGKTVIDGDALTAIDQAAAALRVVDPTLTQEQAIEKAVMDEPDLYTAQLKEG